MPADIAAGELHPLRTVLDLPGDPHGKESACKAGDLGSIPGKLHGQKRLVGYIVHGVAKSQTRLSN